MFSLTLYLLCVIFKISTILIVNKNAQNNFKNTMKHVNGYYLYNIKDNNSYHFFFFLNTKIHSFNSENVFMFSKTPYRAVKTIK